MREWLGTRTAVLVVFIVAVVLLTSSCQAMMDIRHRAASSPPSGVEEFDVGPAGRHTEGVVVYAQSPPVGGEHNPVWQNSGFYEDPVRNETAVHTLEHGAVWITYSPDLPQEDKDRIREIVSGQDCVLASPYPNLDAPVVASAWGKQLALEGTDDPDLERFVRAYKRGPHTPEPGAPCSGGVGSPQ